MKTEETIQTTLKELKEAYLYTIQNMNLDTLDNDTIKMIFKSRNSDSFRSSRHELNESIPVKDEDVQYINRDAIAIYSNISEIVDDRIAALIMVDYELMAKYLICGKNDWRIASMFTFYTKREIPITFIKSTNLVKYTFWELQSAVKIAKFKDKIEKILKKRIDFNNSTISINS